MPDFRVKLDIYSGPLDLLLFLVRKEEVQVVDLALAELTEQYLEFVSVLEQIDVDMVGDFLDTASQLLELKSRLVLPHGEEEAEEPEIEDPRHDLVARLLEFKKYRDAAEQLEMRGREWQERYPRLATDVEMRSPNPAELEIGGVELWDLVSAFGRVLREKLKAPDPTNIRYDDTPIHVYMRQIDQRLRHTGKVTFSELFPEAVHKSTLVGMFLALLELVRYRHARARQDDRYGEILIEPGSEPYPDGEAPPVEARCNQAAGDASQGQDTSLPV